MPGYDEAMLPEFWTHAVHLPEMAPGETGKDLPPEYQR
jgi:hypothetical protein